MDSNKKYGSWSRNGNAPGTQFVMVCSVSGGAWTLLDIVTKTSYIHNTGHILAQVYQYLVKARRGSDTSGPSNIAVAGVPIPVNPAVWNYFLNKLKGEKNEIHFKLIANIINLPICLLSLIKILKAARLNSNL